MQSTPQDSAHDRPHELSDRCATTATKATHGSPNVGFMLERTGCERMRACAMKADSEVHRHRARRLTCLPNLSKRSPFHLPLQRRNDRPEDALIALAQPHQLTMRFHH